ncbi:hypothetical protein FH968_19745 [Buttiauxella sp. B2]|uniref:hypothetical protein n=1 Tax=Buttiauxella sp. B2 TaxID=2587812 RepID=UPI00111F4370|nr:hypothetical protein [Buttiauxella sp. B2]TNV16078.1 hypothetical protein FH968_19745 [Buttiauxella sp. B2]
MELFKIGILIVISGFGVRCFWTAWYIHPGTTDKAGDRFTDKQLKEFAKTDPAKSLVRWRRNMFIAGGVISVGAICMIAYWL